MRSVDVGGRDWNAWPWNAWRIPNGGLSRADLEGVSETVAEERALAAVLRTTDKFVKSGGTATVLVPRSPNGHGVMFHHANYGGWCDDDEYDIVAFPWVRVWAALLAAGYTVASDTLSTTAQWGDVDMGEQMDTTFDFASKFVSGEWVHVAVSKGTVSALLTLSPDGPAGHLHYGAGAYIIDGCTNLAHTYITNPFGSTAAIDTAHDIPGGGTYAVQTAGRDPNLLPDDTFAGKRLRFVYSPDDTITLAADNALLIGAEKTGTTETSYLKVTGEHGLLSHYVAEDLVSFVGRCVAD